MSGIQDIPFDRIPREWNPKWYADHIRDVLRLLDARNAIGGGGVSVSGTSDVVATIASTTLSETYIVVSPSAELTDERILAVETGVVSLNDGGANNDITVGIETNGLNFNKLQQISTNIFVGRITASTGDMEQLTATQATSLLDVFIGDSGSGGTKGLVLAPAIGDAGKVLQGDGTWTSLVGTFQPLDDTLTTIAATDPTTDQINYFTGLNVASVTSLTAFARTLIDDTTQGAMQTTLDVDPAGTDNSVNVTFSGSLDYLTLSGQQITLNAIDLTTDVTGILPLANGGTGDAAVTSANIGHLKAMDQDVGTSDDVVFDDIVTVGDLATQNWAAAFGTFQAGASALFGSETVDNTIITNNMVFDGTNWRFILTDEASRIQQRSSGMIFQTAGAGTAGNIVTFTTRFRADATNNSTESALEIFYNGSLVRVNVGAADSGGTGQRLLTVDN